jgi:hypothetical protein
MPLLRNPERHSDGLLHPDNKTSSGIPNDFPDSTPKTLAGLPIPVDYPQWIGHKFELDGTVQAFAGNTILSHIPKESDIFQALSRIHEDIKGSGFADLFALLPPPSYHMTILEGVCDTIRDPDHWPRDLALDAPLSECTALFDMKLASFILESKATFEVTIKGWTAVEDGIGLHVVPINDTEEARLLDLRDKLSDCLQIRFPNHVGYGLHVSMGYTLRFLSKEQELGIMAFLNSCLEKLPKTFELGPVEFCTFADMFAFHHVRFLGTGSSLTH